MATKKQASGTTEVRVLVDCTYGTVDSVVELTAEELSAAVATGEVDPHPDAVAYAKSIKE